MIENALLTNDVSSRMICADICIQTLQVKIEVTDVGLDDFVEVSSHASQIRRRTTGAFVTKSVAHRVAVGNEARSHDSGPAIALCSCHFIRARALVCIFSLMSTQRRVHTD
jgi:hypothetical protein